MKLGGSRAMDINSVITKMDKRSVEELMALISQEKISIIKKPETGLLMMTVQDSFNMDFYLGEILATEVRVEYKGLKGYAMVTGDEPDKTLLSASLDAILQSDNKDLIQKVMDVIGIQSKKITETNEMERRLIAKTVVNFETMVKG